ncbi:MAG: YceI family protein [Thermomicrobiales bacterium]
MKGAGLAKKILAVVGMIVAVLLIGVGAVAYSFFKTPAAPSGPIQAIPIVQSTATATTAAPSASAQPIGVQATSTPMSGGQVATTTTVSAQATSIPASATATAPQATATSVAAAQTIATATTGTQAAGAATVFEIEQASSEARFVIDEVLNGADKTVVGATDQVAGQIAVNPTAPGTAQVGVIQINARTLATDSDQRDRAIQNQILNTSKHEYITFTPTSLVGLPASAMAGQSYSFQIVGQLTVAGQTKEATFAVTVTHTADGKLQGTAKTEIKYANWGISVPKVPQVASVEDTVILEIDFIAKAV